MDLAAFVRRVSANIKRARWSAGFTQSDAAEAAEIDFRHYQRIEKGEVDPKLSTLHALASTFKVGTAAFVETDIERTARDLDRMTKAVPPRTGRKPKKRTRR